ncbi:MAG: DUF3649 domain-containing protein [Pseudomonadota bacterium]|nr:DUF3649 domain-containing protein [Pseudomonadota bacterium]
MRQNPTALWSRSIAALVGGYICANALAIALTGVLPTEKDSAVISGMMMTFALYALAIMWVFSAKTAKRAWLGLTIATALSIAFWIAKRQFGDQP